MNDKKNWWVTIYDGNRNVVEEWLIPNCTHHDAAKEADRALDAMGFIELDNGQHAEAWNLREAIITVDVKGGHVEIEGLPAGWSYEITDHDTEGWA